MEYTIKYEVMHQTGEEGIYKSELIAKRHLRRLKKKYPQTVFKIEVKENKMKGEKSYGKLKRLYR